MKQSVVVFSVLQRRCSLWFLLTVILKLFHTWQKICWFKYLLNLKQNSAYVLFCWKAINRKKNFKKKLNPEEIESSENCSELLYLLSWTTDCLTDCLTDWLPDWLPDCLTDWLTDWLTPRVRVLPE
jgi:hypothetical protein